MSLPGFPVVVVDTSLAVKWVLQESHTREARALLVGWSAAGIQPIVPSWFVCEVANVLFQRVRTGIVTVVAAQAMLRTVLQALEIRDYDPMVAIRAIEIADLLSQRRSYDAQYLALAEHEGCELWTADQRFWTAASRRFPQVNWVGNIRV